MSTAAAKAHTPAARLEQLLEEIRDAVVALEERSRPVEAGRITEISVVHFGTPRGPLDSEHVAPTDPPPLGR